MRRWLGLVRRDAAKGGGVGGDGLVTTRSKRLLFNDLACITPEPVTAITYGPCTQHVSGIDTRI